MKYLLTIVFLLILTSGGFAQTSETPPISLISPYYLFDRSDDQHLELSSEWELTPSDSAVSNPSSLDHVEDWQMISHPTSVQWAYYESGKLPYPYAHLNSERYRWMEKKVWYYRKSFATPTNPGNSYFYLCFDGLDYYSRLWINGQLVGGHTGMFGGPNLEVGEYLNPVGQENELLVEVKAGNYDIWDSYDARKMGEIVRSVNQSGYVGAKPFYPLGMWRGVRLEIVPKAHLARPFIQTREATEKEARLLIETEVLVGKHSFEFELHPWFHHSVLSRGPEAQDIQFVENDYRLQVEAAIDGEIVAHWSFPLQLMVGKNWVRQELSISRPELWQPNGLGSQRLYDFHLQLIKNGSVMDRIELPFGVRKIEWLPTAGPRALERWDHWQIMVNGRPFFVKGINWMPADVLLNLPKSKYRWLLQMAADMGVQMIRIWGGGLLENDDFYDICDELGILVWQDFPILHQSVPDFPLDIWESQVLQTIFRLRNHPSLALYCGGNGMNPYSMDNAAVIGVLERLLHDFDPTRPFIRTSSDAGNIHTYPDMDPGRYQERFQYVPWIAETGMHSITDAEMLHEIIKPAELKDLGNIYSDTFSENHPELMHHFVEYNPSRVPRMLSRASHLIDLSDPAIEELSEASQIGAGEFYQILSEGVQANYPNTTGLLPWVYKRPWPVFAAIHLVDGFGQPSAPYYFMKRTYEPVHVALQLDRLLWKPGETFPVKVQVINNTRRDRGKSRIRVRIFDDRFRVVWEELTGMAVRSGQSVRYSEIGLFNIPAAYSSRFFFVCLEMMDEKGDLLSRSVYWPRTITQMEEAAYYDQYLAEPLAWPTLENGPWLKPVVNQTTTNLAMKILTVNHTEDCSVIRLVVRNTGNIPAFMTQIDITGAKRLFYADDNYFWLAPGEERKMWARVKWREDSSLKTPRIAVYAWNAEQVSERIEMK